MKLLIFYEMKEKHVQQLKENFPKLTIYTCKDRESLFHHLPDTEILVTFKFTKEMLDAAPKLKWVQGLSAGVDAMPLEEMKKRGILLTNGKGIHRIHMAEYAIAAMIAMARNFHVMFRNQIRGKWDRSMVQDEIWGAVLGILGLGSIGNEIAQRASLFGMKVVGTKNRPETVEYVEKVYGPDDMDEVLRQSDYVINLLPYTEETKGIINKSCFDMMKDTACFINMGRGPTVNEEDLIEALKNNKIRGLVTDVYEVEPLPEDSPLWKLDNVILTPHICGESLKYVDRAMEIILHNTRVYLEEHFEDMVNMIELARGY